MAKLEAERAERASWTDAKLDREDEKFSKKHLSSRWGKEPLLPFHMVQWDPMHGLHNEFNALISEVSSKLVCAMARDRVYAPP
mmetsp:Transcript_27747/g.48520  ORF Transcript_27747/g.48520 Transcript_27747/m.48520 type:complete len:83 (+) Transcript_27747:84-332(+)